jgi:hypothetical protein
MKITLLGGGEVTRFPMPGSSQRCHVMVGCGLFQRAQKLENVNRLPPPFAGYARAVIDVGNDRVAGRP